MTDGNDYEKLARLIRSYILTSTTTAGSGHPTSSLSAVELMTALMFSPYFKYDVDNPDNPNNDRLIFSKAHASPLLYALWAAAGAIQGEELQTLRKFGSRLEGHPSMEFPLTELSAGSLGQGLSVGVGMAMNAMYLDKLPYKTYVLLGDSEMAEGSNWEALQLASHYKLNNLIGILDVNRLGQRGETMLGHHTETYQKRVEAFGWKTMVIDGHNFSEITAAYEEAKKSAKPSMIIAKTLKGKGVSFIEDKDNWHGKALSNDELQKALQELGDIDDNIRGKIIKPENKPPSQGDVKLATPLQPDDHTKTLATRKAYGHALIKIAQENPDLVVVDAEVSNSTYSEFMKEYFPQRFFEIFIAEQNMAGVALGLALRKKIVFASTFASFWTRAYDQIRIAQYNNVPLHFVGSHAGVSIGEDGSSQMGLEDISMFRTLLRSTVIYPADHISTEKLVAQISRHKGISYMRTTRMDTEPLYNENDEFVIGGSKTLRSSEKDDVTIVAAGITLYEALKAYDELKSKGISARVIDLYSIKPIDHQALEKAAHETKVIITVEDHFEEGGLGEAVSSALKSSTASIYSLAVRKTPRSGKPAELLDFEEISAPHIVQKVMQVVRK